MEEVRYTNPKDKITDLEKEKYLKFFINFYNTSYLKFGLDLPDFLCLDDFKEFPPVGGIARCFTIAGGKHCLILSRQSGVLYFDLKFEDKYCMKIVINSNVLGEDWQ